MIDMNTVQELAKIENVLEIPSSERLTHWYGDYNIYEPKDNVTQADIDNRIKELDEQLQHGETVYVEVKETLSRLIPVQNPLSLEEAMDIVKAMYESKEIVLDADDYQGVEFDCFEMEPELDMEM